MDDEYIRRKAAVDAVCGHWCDSSRTIDAIRSIPAADVAPVVHGRWVNTDYLDGHTVGECSECHKIRIVDNFCAACGAKMDGGQHETD